MSDLIKNITDSDFQATIASGVTVIDFWAPWCGPCKAITPYLEELAGEYGGRVKIVKINVDESQAVASQFNVMSIPTLILFKDGQKLDQKVGGSPKAALKSFIDQAL
jgi:thioredoxin 1